MMTMINFTKEFIYKDTYFNSDDLTIITLIFLYLFEIIYIL